MFAFIIIDFKKNIIISSRDYFGKKPIYYYYDKQSLIISSEIEPIIILKNHLDISIENFCFLFGYYHPRKTIYTQIKKQVKNSIIVHDLKNYNRISKGKIYERSKYF